MSRNIETNFLIEFDSNVKHAYQAERKLAGTVRTKSGVVGASVEFPVIGAGLAHKRVPRTDVVPMGVNHGKAVAYITDWEAPEYSDIYELSKINFDEKADLVQVSSKALGRRYDQIILDALAVGRHPARIVGPNIGGSTDFSVAKIMRAKRYMDDAGVDDGDRHIAVAAGALEQILQEDKVASTDYNIIRGLYEGTIKTYAGFQFHLIARRVEGGLPETVTGGVVTTTSFAWHKIAVGLAVGIEPTVDIDWIAEKTSWLINGRFTGGAVVIDNQGVIAINSQYNEV